MEIQAVTFSEPKDGYAPGDWQDGAYGGVVGDGRARFIVLDGASTAYDPVHWVDLLASSFASAEGLPSAPRLDPASMRTWFGQLQHQWANEPRSIRDPVEQKKFNEAGSMATLLAFELLGLDGPEPFWQGIALGDTVLFHVRDLHKLAMVPNMGPGDFSRRPVGVFTDKNRLDEMTAKLRQNGGQLLPGDFLFAATDAIAKWILLAIARDEKKVWHTLANLADPADFRKLVADQRREQDPGMQLEDDDVTLLRVRILARQPSLLLVCR
ncbi:MAG TPA: hypothetical protein VME19_03025 [Streptosporangiaceae bacterium]|nr:hypothetical protein [Streptosporangiaceae bacterium]